MILPLKIRGDRSDGGKTRTSNLLTIFEVEPRLRQMFLHEDLLYLFFAVGGDMPHSSPEVCKVALAFPITKIVEGDAPYFGWEIEIMPHS